MRKHIYVLRIGDYRPDLCKFTIPTIKAYANKIGAEYKELTHRLFPSLPITFEKFQVGVLGEDNDWNIVIDADMMIHPHMLDVTSYLSPNSVSHAFGFDADSLFKKDIYFERDGRNIGIASNFVVTTRLTNDVWSLPFDYEIEQLRGNCKREFILDEYFLSRNLAKFGLKSSGVLAMPMLTEMLVHFGSEERSEYEKKADALAAEELFKKWETQYEIGSSDNNNR